jgi:hypothetical protein
MTLQLVFGLAFGLPYLMSQLQALNFGYSLSALELDTALSRALTMHNHDTGWRDANHLPDPFSIDDVIGVLSVVGLVLLIIWRYVP